jgi:hypothetical protein
MILPIFRVVNIDYSKSYTNENGELNIDNINRKLLEFLNRPITEELKKEIHDFEKMIQEYEPLFRVVYY